MGRGLFTRRRFLALSGAAALSAGLGLAGCGGDADRPASDAGRVPPPAEAEERDLMGSPDACDVRVGLLMGPSSMGLSQFIVAARNGRTRNGFSFEPNDVDYIGLAAKLNDGAYDIATLPSNIGPILYNNGELKNEYQVIAANNLGVLYVVTADPDVRALGDLAGRRVYAYGEGGTPEYTIEALLGKTGLDGTFNLEFKPTPFEVLNLLQQEEGCAAILPQPFVSLSKRMVDRLHVPIDISDEWDAAFAGTGSRIVTSTTIANRAFLEQHEQAVAEYLQMAGRSVEWTLDNMEDAAALQEELGTFMNNDVALDALPDISLVCLTGGAMKTALSGFIGELHAADPDSVGGAVPGDGFYYMPPAGTVADEAIGLDRA